MKTLLAPSLGLLLLSTPASAQESGVFSFPRRILPRSAVATVVSRGTPGRAMVLPRGTRLEWLPGADPEKKPALLAGGREVWLPPDTPEGEDSWGEIPDLGQIEAEVEGLGPSQEGLEYRWVRWQGARLHLVRIDLSARPDWECAPRIAPRFLPEGTGPRTLEVELFAKSSRIHAALNGPFFIPGGRIPGKPLGAVIQDEELVFHPRDSSLAARQRSWIAWTSHGRLVTGEDPIPALDPGQRLSRSFASSRLRPGERILHGVGGLGRLARAGEPQAWRREVGRQFSASFYSARVARPQSLLGIGPKGLVLWLLVQEGKPSSKRCHPLGALSAFLQSQGAAEVLFSDGGGSADLVVQGRSLVRTEGARAKRPVSTVWVVRTQAPRQKPLVWRDFE